MKTSPKASCPDCGKTVASSGLQQHIHQTTCQPPEMTNRQLEIVKGLLMGDAHGKWRGNGARFNVDMTMTNKKFLEWLNDELGYFANPVRHVNTPKELADKANRNPNRPNADPEDYKDTFNLAVRNVPDTQHFAKWYDTGEKRFPSGLELTPISTKMWYCCDGTMIHGEYSWKPRICAANEEGRDDFLKGLFWDAASLRATIQDDFRIAFTGNEKKGFLKYMGDAPPGFEYKWETYSKSVYKRKIREAYEFDVDHSTEQDPLDW